MDRRNFIVLSGSTISLSAAGCLDNISEETDDHETNNNDISEPSDNTNNENDEDDNQDNGDSSGDENSEENNTENRNRLSHLDDLDGQTYPQDPHGNYQRDFEWEAFDSRWSFTAQIPENLVDYYSDRLRQNNRGQFVSDPYDNEAIEDIAEMFESIGDDNDLSDREIVDLATKFVQQLEYTPDEVAVGFSQHTFYPLETLEDRGGDCEDTSVLLASILREMGYDVVLFAMWEEEHMALGVSGSEEIQGSHIEYDGNSYYYLETTAPGYEIGDVPPGIEDADVEIQDIHSHPTLVYGWRTETDENGEVTIIAQVQNVGSEIANNVSFQVETIDDSEQIHNQDVVNIGTLDSDQSEMVQLTVNPPVDKPLKIKTGVEIDNSLHDTDISTLENET